VQHLISREHDVRRHVPLRTLEAALSDEPAAEGAALLQDAATIDELIRSDAARERVNRRWTMVACA
jgi:hypothetical protein